MKRVLVFLFVVLFTASLALLCTGCVMKTVKGELVTETYSIDAADSFIVKDLSMKVSGEGIGPTVDFVTDGGAPEVVVTMQKGMFDTVKLNQNGKKLTFSGKKRYVYLTDYDVKVTVKNCVFTDIELHGAVKATVEDGCLGSDVALDLSGASSLKGKTLTCNTFDLNESGASNVTFDTVVCAQMTADLSGASTFAVTTITVENAIVADASGASRYGFTNGAVPTLSVDLSGASSFDAIDVLTTTVTVDASGASLLKITCNGTITGDASGASTVEYKGAAATNVDTSGGSNVRKA